MSAEFVFVILCAALLPLATAGALRPNTFANTSSTAQRVTALAFGSCMDQRVHAGDALLDHITLHSNADALVLLGDNIYADTRDLRAISSMYAQQHARPAFARLAAAMPVLAIYDDHDFAFNDVKGSNMPLEHRSGSQHMLLDFQGVDVHSVRRRRRGSYERFVMGPPQERVAIVMLDARYFLTEPNADSATVIGDEQWQWLQGLPALDAQEHVALTVVVSSIQVVNNQSYGSENWGLYPAERARMLALLRSWPCAVVVISGDRHYSEIAQECSENSVVLEVTTSGIDKGRALPQLQFDCNPFRVAPFVTEISVAVVAIDWAARRAHISLLSPRSSLHDIRAVPDASVFFPCRRPPHLALRRVSAVALLDQRGAAAAAVRSSRVRTERAFDAGALLLRRCGGPHLDGESDFTLYVAAVGQQESGSQSLPLG